MIELQTLGDAVIRVGDREIRPTSPTLFAALLYLGVERGQRIPRAALQELLFPETDERSGAHSLRQLLYKVRQLGVSVQAEGDVVWLEAGEVTDDYSAPVHTNGNGNGNGHRNSQFLAGYAPRLSVALDEWLEARRATISAAQRRALIKQMLARRDAADWASVERIAQEVLAGDPFNEEATFALAESTALSGSKSEAIRILERYESETGRADLKLPASILRRRISEKLPDRRRRALDTPFVGRDAEAQMMREAVVRLRGGEGGTIVIQGEPGIGKTRLIEETAALALLEGVNVHVVRCQPHYVNRPMGVFIEWVPLLLASRGALGVAPETLEHLKLLTSHRDDRADRPTDARDDATRSGTLLAAIRDLVDAVASEAPILLVVEDAHWADATSLRDLCVLLERRRNASVLVIHTARVTEPLSSVGVLTENAPLVRLRPLGPEAMHDLSGQLLAGTTPARDDVREWCAATAAGNPFYLQMLCAHYEETQRPFAVPPGVRNATMRRLEQTPAPQRRLLELSALLGRHATLSALRTLMEVSNSTFIDVVHALEEAGFLRTHDGAARLSHDVLRECTLDSIPALTKQLLHGVVAAHLEARYADDPETSLLWDCAEHWVASGEATNALRFVLRCAHHAMTIGRADQAHSILAKAAPLASGPEERLQVLEQVACVAGSLCKWNEVIASAAEATSIVRLLRPGEIPWDWLLRQIEARWSSALNADQARDVLSACVSSNARTILRVKAAQLLVRIAYEQLDADLAQTAFRSVEHLLDSDSADYSLRMLPLMYHTTFGDGKAALRTVDRLIGDLDRFPISERLRAAKNSSVALNTLGESRRALDLSAAYYERVNSWGLAEWRYDFAVTSCCAATGLHEFEIASHWYDLASSFMSDSAGHLIEFSHLATGMDLALLQADREVAEKRMRLLERLPIASSGRFDAIVKASRLRLANLDPNYRSDDAELDDIRDVFERAARYGCGDSCTLAYSEALRRRGRVNEATVVAREYLQMRRDVGPVPPELLRLIA
jgi:DNA-binding SARP family transcriptional activator